MAQSPPPADPAAQAPPSSQEQQAQYEAYQRGLCGAPDPAAPASSYAPVRPQHRKLRAQAQPLLRTVGIVETKEATIGNLMSKVSRIQD